MKKSLHFIVAFFLALTLSACGSADKPFLGFWKVQGDRFEYLKIEKNGEGHLLTIYDNSSKLTEYPVTIKDNTLTINMGAFGGVTGVYKEADKTLVLGGKQVYTKVDDADALKVIEAKKQERAKAKAEALKAVEARKQEKAKAEADCKALQEEVDRKNQELKGKNKEAWNAYVKSLKERTPDFCWLKNAGKEW